MSFTLCPICGQRNDTTGHTCWVQTIAPTAWNNHIDIRTDNGAVIRALEKRVEELEAVAETAGRAWTEGECYGYFSFDTRNALELALRAAGYLND